MPSQLLTNEHVTFVVSKPFSSQGKTYAVGDDFPQEDARNIEVFVRARYVIPVLEDWDQKPFIRQWHREIRPKDEVLAKLGRANVQLRMPHEYDSDDEVNLTLLTRPELTPATEGSVGAGEEPDDEDDEEPEVEPVEEVPVPAANEFDPSEHTVTEVQEYIAAHPQDEERVLQLEAADRARKGIVGE